MEKTIIIRIGEIFLKGNNKGFFLSILKRNINNALSDFNCKLSVSQNRFFVEEFNESDENKIVEILQTIFGISSISVAVKIKTDLEELKQVCIKIFPQKGKFRVTVKRADKSLSKNSMDIAKEIGKYMLENCNGISVNLFQYDFEVNIDIRENGYTYVFYKKIQCAGGLPVGSAGNAILLLSGGIDSPVSAYMMAKRGLKIFAVHFHSFPYTSEQAKEKVIDLSKKLSVYCGEITLCVVPFTNIQYAIKENCPIEYMITIMRRFMMRISEKIASKFNCGAIITGESLGQVASQTIESITTTNSVVSLPVFRPLIGMDKCEIIDISKKIDTFDISILPYEDCCTVFLPDRPIIRPNNKTVAELESKIDNIMFLEKEAIDNMEILHCHY